MTQYKTYDQVGKKESVDDIISNISPTDTPFQSSIGSEKVKATLFQWQEDALRAPAKNAKVEGFTASSTARVPTSMRSNYTQIFSETVNVSATADEIDTYGRAKELSYQLAKTASELKRDLELSLVGNAQTAVAGDSSTAREMASAQAQIDATQTYTTDSDAGTGGNQAGPLTEDNFLEANQGLYEAGGEATIFMVKPADSLVVAEFAQASGRNREIAQGTKLVNVIDVLVTPFGEQKVVINRFIKSTDALLFDPGMWKKVVLRGWTRETLAKIGDNTSVMIVGEFSLKHRNYKGSALITNLT